ncbi:right-handed parallel beta-helix repeat-containing protein [Oceaniglobus ichthyenteri]|uniref:right-handed parallel beta-helix repeat-containing protein n=1 Tax=Oceaniglobus ichthyenteri TaxID=2136177 RepID=UPI0013DDD5B6|nr:right-handed parallel beta-helix repeat-containing protein [Oceaniglobus ichthyenteri]
MFDLLDRMKPMVRRAVLALVGGFLTAGVALAATDRVEDRALRDGITALAAMVADPAQASAPAQTLLQQAGLASLVAPTAPPGPIRPPANPVRSNSPVEAQPLDMRLALTMLTQIAGARDTQAVLTAQGPESDLRALVIRKGDATLTDVALFLSHYRLQDTAAGDLILRVPLVIWEGATLTLKPGETLRLSRPDGAFMVNFGHITMEGATARIEGDVNPYLARFAPFMTTAGSGTFYIQNSEFHDLGFGRTRAFAGFSMMRNNLMVVRNRSFIRDSLFRGTVSVVVSGASDVALTGNRVFDARGEGMIVAGSPRANMVSNIIVGDSKFNALQVVEGSVDAVVSGNVVLNGEKAGIVVRSNSHRPHVANNIVWHRKGGGITVDHANCANVQANFVLDNSQKGIEVRSSDGALVRDNHLIQNQSAGIWISAQEPEARTFVVQNVLHANRSGLATATAQEVILQGNDFRGQFPQFLSGDVAGQSRHIAENMQGTQPMLLTASGVSVVPSAIGNCATH